MTAPRIRERKGAVWSDVIVRASAPFASRSHKEDTFDTGRWHNRLTAFAVIFEQDFSVLVVTVF